MYMHAPSVPVTLAAAVFLFATRETPHHVGMYLGRCYTSPVLYTIHATSHRYDYYERLRTGADDWRRAGK